MVVTAYNGHFVGAIEVICGPMFSGKTEELIRRVRRAQIARIKVQVFRPAIDRRYDDKNVVSHSAQSVEATPITHAIEILQKLYDSTRVVAIDEVQFLDEEIVVIVRKLAKRGIRVILAGLDLDYRGRPFGAIPQLLALADTVYKIHAICTVCGAPASKTQRTAVSTDRVLVGAAEHYEARCNAHHDPHDEDWEQLPLQTEFSMPQIVLSTNTSLT